MSMRELKCPDIIFIVVPEKTKI